MKQRHMPLFAVIGLTLACPFSPIASAQDEKAKQPEKKPAKKRTVPALRYKMKDIDGKTQNLKQYHGNVVLMVNVASQCGLTPQYEGLEAIQKKYAERGFVVLAFPANDFGRQEPGTNSEIKQFCSSKYGVSFPMFAKVSVVAPEICKLYKYLTDEKADHKKGGKIKWNFTKFLIDREGRVVERFHPRVKPRDEALIKALERELGQPVPEKSSLAKQRKAKKKTKAKKKG